MSIGDFLISFVAGGAAYCLMELFYRRRTHISMAIAGGLSFAVLYGLYSRYEPGWIFAIALGIIFITAVELIVGYIVNIRLKLNVWDYSKLPLNLFGQVCIPYSAIWGILSYAILLVTPIWSNILVQINAFFA